MGLIILVVSSSNGFWTSRGRVPDSKPPSQSGSPMLGSNRRPRIQGRFACLIICTEDGILLSSQTQACACISLSLHSLIIALRGFILLLLLWDMHANFWIVCDPRVIDLSLKVQCYEKTANRCSNSNFSSTANPGLGHCTLVVSIERLHQTIYFVVSRISTFCELKQRHMSTYSPGPKVPTPHAVCQIW